MSLKDQIENISTEIETHREKIQNLQTEMVQIQDNFAKVLQQADDIVKSTTDLAQNLEIPCKETISLGESLKMLQDEIRGKLQTKDMKWEDIITDIENSNSCFRDYLDRYQTTVLNLADQTSMELDPNDSVTTSATPKTSLESSSSHFQQMLVAHDPLADRELFNNLNIKSLSVTENIQTMKEQLDNFKETSSIIATEVERISKNVQNVYENNFADEKEASNNVE
ncbi:hypothetical protein LSTR_LSTR012847 [Laodelphax striatellus]|uniref:Uncharacterized protein n=1 Tax=Laodelphax striatellus TaxID=195883 RepID=A0A482XPM3_LAOST|nr:hypothetical protein LSTR_LSTR012847 [Laodelphax striatellus]